MKLHKKLLFFLLLPLTILFVGFATDIKDDYFEISKNLDIFGKLYREVNSLYVEETDPSKLMRTGVDAMLKSLDPYTTYISEEEKDKLTFMSTGEYGGIGTLVQKRGDRFIITEPYKGAPADRAGLKIGDEILKVGEQSVVGEEVVLKDIKNLLRGENNSAITLTVKRPGESDPREISVTREKIKVKNVPYYGLAEDRIGYIKLTGFTRGASREVQSAYEILKMESSKLESLILDLRGNPGGRLDEAVKIVNLFVLQKETVVETRGRQENSRRIHYAQRVPVDTKIPLVVLIDKQSASASEIVAGALQDLDRAVLVGQRSFGKGLVQNIRPLAYEAKLKVTTAKYYTPSGRCIQALDYGERDKNGRATRIPDSLKSEFSTRNGRKVRDGGGIKPDLEVQIGEEVSLISSLKGQGVIFDFVTDFSQKNAKIASPREFVLDDQVYSEFMDFVKSKKFSYQTNSDRELEDLRDVLQKEAYASELSKEIDLLGEKLEEMKMEDLKRYQDRVSWLIKEEIVKRYYYRNGIIEAALDHDQEVKEATSVLSNKKKYQQVLQGTGN
ncbi:MAG: S41 family peptidase [Bacteroidia bacterium]|nr:S41 family peptidase [Bacteroidia bacterium]